MIEIKETDKRHKLHNSFAFVLEVRGAHAGKIKGRHIEFNDVRQWCWESFGPSCEREHWLQMNPNVNHRWCWHTEFNELKIYLASDKEATWAKLKWAEILK